MSKYWVSVDCAVALITALDRAIWNGNKGKEIMQKEDLPFKCTVDRLKYITYNVKK